MTGKTEAEIGLTTARLETLTDGVFAIAMTLLVLNLKLPLTGKGVTERELEAIIYGQFNLFFNYFLSFILLALFWMLHHQQFHYFRKTDRSHIWINIFILMFVALIPFSASLVGTFAHAKLDEFFFALNMFIIGSLFFLNWIYATNQHRLVDAELSTQRIAVGRRRALVLPVVSLTATATVVINPAWSGYIYLLIPFILWLPSFRR